VSEGSLPTADRPPTSEATVAAAGLSRSPPLFRRFGLAILPLVVFLGLAAVLYARLGAGDAARLPSALIGQAAPSLGLPGLDETKPGLVDSDLRQGHVTLVNVFASWCQPCHVEHEFLLSLANDPALKVAGVALVGVAQKDSPENIRRFLGAAGDPYAKVGLDSEGRAGIDWGVYGVPETFIVRGDGVIAYKVIGPISAETLESVVKPEIAKAMK
jgi:cytochrome c biogenesis protein CcmG/thiol:disulfide interchange protein DsbE